MMFKRAMLRRKILGRSKWVAWVALWMSASVTSFAGADEALSYEQARQQLLQQSDAIHAADFQVDTERDRRQALDRLRLPTLTVSAGVLAYGSERELDIQPLQQALGQAIPSAGQLVPSSVDLDFNAVNTTAALTSSWLLYTGGRTGAARRFAESGIALAEAAREGTREHQEKLLATLYFGHLLARQVLEIRNDVLEGVERHLHLATRFEDRGVLSKVERLHAQVTYDEARRNVAQAQADFGIADVALRRLLRSEQPIKPQTLLFVLTRPLAPLSDFLKAGLENHSQVALLRAKRHQAIEGKVVEQARWKPSVAAYGAYNLAPQDADLSDPLPLLQPDWLVGVNVTYTLFDRHNRRRLVSAAEGQIQRVSALQRELETGLATLIESSYRSVDRARAQFVLLDSSIELAQETLLLRERLFTEGLGTSLDVVDARLAAARAETERAAAAYAFVVSLVDLLEASGQLERFNDYVGLADVRLSIEEKKK
jgi:outer membrane protein TolC